MLLWSLARQLPTGLWPSSWYDLAVLFCLANFPACDDWLPQQDYLDLLRAPVPVTWDKWMSPNSERNASMDKVSSGLRRAREESTCPLRPQLLPDIASHATIAGSISQEAPVDRSSGRRRPEAARRPTERRGSVTDSTPTLFPLWSGQRCTCRSTHAPIISLEVTPITLISLPSHCTALSKRQASTIAAYLTSRSDRH